MALDSRRRNRGFPDSIGQQRLGARARLRLTLLASCLVSVAAAAQAQETVVIGGGPAPSGGYAAPAPIGELGNGIQVNDSVLDSLGAGPAGAVPMAAPQTPVYGAGLTAPGAASTEPSGAYRLPGSGELVVTRPSTLLYPPMEAPQSHLALTPPKRTASQPAMQNAQRGSIPAPDMADGKLKSRLIAEPPKQPMAAPTQAAEAPMTPKAVQQPKAAQAAAPKAAAPAPAMPSLTEPSKAAAEPVKKAPAPAVAASIAPAPRQEAPKAASVAAPSIPKAPAPAPVATPVAPPGPPSSLTAAKPAPSPSTATAPAKPMQSAALTEGTATGTTSARAGELRLGFAEGSAELSDEAKQSLLDLAKSLAQDTSSRVQLLAYAADGGEGTSRARRLSLSRALAVRAFLIDQGVRSTRMDVRALGSNAGDGPADRVDILAR